MILIKARDGSIREVEEGIPYRLANGEQVIGSKREKTVLLGDLAERLIESTGFKKWWEIRHGGPCAACQKRKAVLNYIQFKGPEWFAQWVKNGGKDSDSR